MIANKLYNLSDEKLAQILEIMDESEYRNYCIVNDYDTSWHKRIENEEGFYNEIINIEE